MNIIRVVILAIFGLVYSSCTRSSMDSYGDEVGGPVEIRLKVQSPSFSGGIVRADKETDINRLRILVFGSTTSADAGKLLINKFYSSVPLDGIKEVVTAGRRDVYMIVNEPLSSVGQELPSYKNISKVGDIRVLELLYGGAGGSTIYEPSEIPMFIANLDKLLKVDIDNIVNGEVERVMAKVTIKLNVSKSNFGVGKHIVVDRLQIKNLPQKSYLIAQGYTGSLVSSEVQNAKVVVASSGYDASIVNTFYVPEHILSQSDRYSYIEVFGHVFDEPTKVAKWVIKLGDGMDDGKVYGDQYNITRNRHYTFTGDIKTYGDVPMDLEVKVAVTPWNTVNISDEAGSYIYFEKVTNVGGVELLDGYNLSDVGDRLQFHCSTNVGGWHILVTDAKGVISRSAVTDVVTSSTSQVVEIVIPKDKAEPYVQGYTFGIFHKDLASETVGPVKSIRMTQYGGWLPNATLKASGWPSNQLPAGGGIWVAMRGDGKVPGSEAEADDLTKIFKSDGSATFGIESTTTFANAMVGMGKLNTDAMMAQSAQHPGGSYCRSMGVDWYMPSIKELDMIYKNKDKLGGSYGFNSTLGYWSSTEFSPANGWSLIFSDGTKSNGSKSVASRVRCIKGDIPVPPPVITLDKTSQADILAAGGTYTVKVTSNYAWSVSSTVSGVTISPASGVAGTDTEVVITVPKNPSTTVARDVPVVFKATSAVGDATATWTGRQVGAAPGSYIPRANLVASGWSYFPGAIGLQVAMRGDKQMPGTGTPGNDPGLQWKTSNTTTAGVENVTDFANAVFGKGKANTDAMIAAGAGDHPAAAYCRSMGAEWYLPSLKELKAIYQNKSVLGPSYTFANASCWSSTEGSSNSSWHVGFNYGNANSNVKSNSGNVRCVREI